MEIDLFPVVPSGVPLQWALQAMNASDRSAVVARTGAGYAFVEAADVVIAIAERTAEWLEPLTSRVPLNVIHPSEFGGTLDFTNPPAEQQLQRLFDRLADNLLILALTESRALVASRSELFMPEQAGPRNCYCRIDRKSVSPGVNGGDCPHHVAHRGTVRCI